MGGLYLRFGGLTVLDGVSLHVPAGNITFAGSDGTRLPAARAALGMARTFQNIALFGGHVGAGQHQGGRSRTPARRPAGRGAVRGPCAARRATAAVRDRARSGLAGRGRIVALLGANGAGKTTAIRAVAGPLAYENGAVTAGRTLLDGRPIDRMPAYRRARRRWSRCWKGTACSRT